MSLAGENVDLTADIVFNGTLNPGHSSRKGESMEGFYVHKLVADVGKRLLA